MIWKASAPSNIALIKYMGKLDFSENIPSNPSLSYTLENLRTFVEIKQIDSNQDVWKPLCSEGLLTPTFSENGQQRFLTYFQKLKNIYDVKGYFEIQSANNFPSDSGLASSASSFAALTMAADKTFQELGFKNGSDQKLYQLSRRGSGSSCRSFFSPWALWNNSEVYNPDISLKLNHQVVIVDSKVKEVSSGQAHKRIESSLLNPHRSLRAGQRLTELLDSFHRPNWQKAFDVCWAEFWDMHALFETSMPPFRYVSPESFKVLEKIQNFWKTHNDGPLVTMDAGPNVHLLWREDHNGLREKFIL